MTLEGINLADFVAERLFKGIHFDGDWLRLFKLKMEGVEPSLFTVNHTSLKIEVKGKA